MKHTTTILTTLALIFLISQRGSAQFSFGMESQVEKGNEYAEISLPATAFEEIIRESGEGISKTDVCLDGEAVGALRGYQADFDGDGTEEMFLLYHSGSETSGCNVLTVIAPIGGGKYRLFDVFSFPGGKSLIRPIKVLENGIQMYLQNAYTNPDGTHGWKGTILSFQQTAILILTSWIQQDFVRDGKHMTEDVRTVFSDMNFDGKKEMFVRYNTHEASRANISEKNLVDSYVLTLDFLPQHLRYGVYDSSGYDKLQESVAMAKSGERMLHRDASRVDGIVKIRQALSMNPFLTSTRVALGTHFLMSGKYADAEQTLLQAVEFDPSYAQSYKILGDTYLRLNDLQKALWAYTTYLELNPRAKDRKKVEHNIKQITIPKRR